MPSNRAIATKAKIKRLTEDVANLSVENYPKSIREFCRENAINDSSFRTAAMWHPLFLKVAALALWGKPVAAPGLGKRALKVQQRIEETTAAIRAVLDDFAAAGGFPPSMMEITRRARVRYQCMERPAFAELRSEIKALIAEGKLRKHEARNKAAVIRSDEDYERLRATNQACLREATKRYRVKMQRERLRA